MSAPAPAAPVRRARSAVRRLAACAAGAAALLAALAPARRASAQEASPAAGDTTPAAPQDEAWYERISLRGYAQVRHNGLYRSNDDYECAQCDRSLGGNGGFFLRRARLVVSGDVTDRLSVYLQPDFASEANGSLHYLQLRDAYFDLALDARKTWRVRVGQSKMPYGWENMQSSSVRVALDRTDAINSALINERDLGVLLYWAPAHVRERLEQLVDSGLKGSGDYGVVGVGVFNGQGANRAEANDRLHSVARVSYPFRLRGGQYVELGVQGYTGEYVLPSSLRSPGLVGPASFLDRRVAGTLVVYPQPFGVQAEWNVGRGPEVDPAARTVAERRLDGGYVQLMLRARAGRHEFLPYARAQRYDGGKKFETDARHHRVRELVAGVEWQPLPSVELTAEYLTGTRRFEDLEQPDNEQAGRVLRLQAQLSF